MVSDVVSDRRVGCCYLCEGWKFRQEGEVGAGRIFGAEGGSWGGRKGADALYL